MTCIMIIKYYGNIWVDYVFNDSVFNDMVVYNIMIVYKYIVIVSQ